LPDVEKKSLSGAIKGGRRTNERAHCSQPKLKKKITGKEEVFPSMKIAALYVVGAAERRKDVGRTFQGDRDQLRRREKKKRGVGRGADFFRKKKVKKKVPLVGAFGRAFETRVSRAGRGEKKKNPKKKRVFLSGEKVYKHALKRRKKREKEGEKKHRLGRGIREGKGFARGGGKKKTQERRKGLCQNGCKKKRELKKKKKCQKKEKKREELWYTPPGKGGRKLEKKKKTGRNGRKKTRSMKLTHRVEVFTYITKTEERAGLKKRGSRQNEQWSTKTGEEKKKVLLGQIDEKRRGGQEKEKKKKKLYAGRELKKTRLTPGGNGCAEMFEEKEWKKTRTRTSRQAGRPPRQGKGKKLEKKKGRRSMP